MGVEERALSQALGEAYRRYMARTKRLIPGVY
jgi:protein-S-isoprenylcysteine O-methyltransferase Ste14